MKIRPLHDRVIVKRLDEERTSPGGIVIPDTAAEKPVQGKIVAVGKGKILEDGQVRPLDVKVGDKILFGKYSGTEAKVDGDELVVMRWRASSLNRTCLAGIVVTLCSLQSIMSMMQPLRSHCSMIPTPYGC